MAEQKKDKKIVWKSIGAVAAGFLIVVILSTVTDAILEAAGLMPQIVGPSAYMREMLFVALIYRSAYTLLGGFVTAKLAPNNPMKHVKILAIIGTCGGILGAIAGWNLSEHWYPIALAVTAFPLVWYGGRLGVKNKQ